MEFNYWDLGQRSRGEIVEVKLSGNAANVRLVDSSNFRAFKAGGNHKYYGGHATRSPVRLQVPQSGHWFLVVDFGGFAGRSKVSVQVLPGPLPHLREISMPSIDPIGRNIAAARDQADGETMEAEWDVFISHATEDKEEVVSPLVYALQEQDLNVWYDEFELKIGDSLRRKIDIGLARSRFGVVVLSHAFFSKNWSQYELDGLVTREMTGEQVILPLWHRITKEEVIGYSPSLADKIARSTSESTIEEIATEIASIVHSA